MPQFQPLGGLSLMGILWIVRETVRRAQVHAFIEALVVPPVVSLSLPFPPVTHSCPNWVQQAQPPYLRVVSSVSRKSVDVLAVCSAIGLLFSIQVHPPAVITREMLFGHPHRIASDPHSVCPCVCVFWGFTSPSPMPQAALMRVQPPCSTLLSTICCL